MVPRGCQCLWLCVNLTMLALWSWYHGGASASDCTDAAHPVYIPAASQGVPDYVTYSFTFFLRTKQLDNQHKMVILLRLILKWLPNRHLQILIMSKKSYIVFIHMFLKTTLPWDSSELVFIHIRAIEANTDKVKEVLIGIFWVTNIKNPKTFRKAFKKSILPYVTT